MKITSVRAIALTAPFIHARSRPDHPGNGVRNCVWARVETDAGLTGWGECYLGCYAPEVTIAAIERLSGSIAGETLDDTGAVLKRMRFWNRYWAMRGIGAQSTSAIEGALLDLRGQVEQQPVWKLLGGEAPQPVVLYASVGLNRLSPEEIREEARHYSALGYRAYKMRCGGDADQLEDRLAIDRERVAAARDGLGPERMLFVDLAIPQRPVMWERGRIEGYFDACEPYDVRFFEEPAMTYDVNRYRELQAMGRIPVAGGESFSCPEEFDPFFEQGALGVAQPDAAVVGGPASCVDVCRRAHGHGVAVCLHCWSAGVGIAQNLHAAFAAPGGVLAMEGPQAEHPPASQPIASIWRFQDGFLLPPDAPGLGLTISEEFLARYSFQPGRDRYY